MFFPDADYIKGFIIEAMGLNLEDFTVLHESGGVIVIKTTLFDLKVFYKKRLLCRKGVSTNLLWISGIFVYARGGFVRSFSPAALEFYQSSITNYNNPLAYKAKLKERISEWSSCNAEHAVEALFE
jgi:hypothetical protein